MPIGGGKKSGGGRSNGKGRWMTIGYLWESSGDAKYAASGRIDTLPVDSAWDGRVFLYPNKGGKNQKNPADYKLSALVGGGEQRSSSSSSSNKGDDEEGDDFDEEEEGPEEETETGPVMCGFCGETVNEDTIYCPIGKDLRAANELCRLKKYRDPEDVPEGETPF